MSEFIINATNTSGAKGTITADVGFFYTDNLNDKNIAEIKISGTSVLIRTLLEEGSIIEILKDGTRDFYGLIQTIDYLEAGGIVCRVDGFEARLIQENIDTQNETWLNTASATIATAIIAMSNYWTAGTIQAGLNLDFRANLSESLWDSLQNLNKKTAQDIGLDYVNLQVDILNHKGSSSSVATFNQGIEIDNLRLTKTFPLGNHIKVYGGGDGDLQSTGTDEDATSISTYGRITRRVIDRTIISDDEAGKLATAELALTKDPTKYVTFMVKNPSQSVVSGDHIKINSTDHDLSNEEVRIVSIKRGMESGREFLNLEVTNPAYKQLLKNRNKIFGGLQISTDQTSSYNKSTSAWSDNVSGNFSETNPLKLRIFVPSSLSAKDGSSKLDSIKLNYTCKSLVVPVTTGNHNYTSCAGPSSGHPTGNNTWQSNLSARNNPSQEYLMHVCYGSIEVVHDCGPTDSGWGETVKVRVHNLTENLYFPESAGILLSVWWASHDRDVIILPFSIVLPYSWNGHSWRLEYLIENETNWVTIQHAIYYSYFSQEAWTPEFVTKPTATTATSVGVAYTTGTDITPANRIYAGSVVDSGTTDGTTANFLDDSTQNFTSTVTVGDRVKNTTDNTWAIVTSVVSDIKLGLDTDIMVSGENYTIYDGYGLEEDSIDLSSFITSTGWYTVELKPNKPCYINASLVVKANEDISTTL